MPSPTGSDEQQHNAFAGVAHIQREREKRQENNKLAMRAVQQEKERYGADLELVKYMQMVDEERSKVVASSLPDAPKPEHAKVAVFVRKRPLNDNEVRAKCFDIATTVAGENWGGRVVMHEPKRRVDLAKYIENHKFDFDLVFNETSNNGDVYAEAVSPLMERLAKQDNTMATVFAYGQTGSGKTYTISSFYLAAAEDILQVAKARGDSVGIRFYEVYGGKCFDLLSGRKRVEPMEDAKGMVQLMGLAEHIVHLPEEIAHAISVGLRSRSTGCTSANAQSSRSHSLFEFILRGDKNNINGKLALVDLAGSERGADRGNTDSKTRREGAEINKSLLALKECIRGLHAACAEHIPFRGSRLTHIMRDAFIGKHSHTVLLAHISPSSGSAEHTVNTLRYAIRLKEINPDEMYPQARGNGGAGELGIQLERIRDANAGFKAPPPVKIPVSAEPEAHEGNGMKNAFAKAAEEAEAKEAEANQRARDKHSWEPEKEKSAEPVKDDPPTPQRLLEQQPAVNAILKPPKAKGIPVRGVRPIRAKSRKVKPRPEWVSDFAGVGEEDQHAFMRGGNVMRTPAGAVEHAGPAVPPWEQENQENQDRSAVAQRLNFGEEPPKVSKAPHVANVPVAPAPNQALAQRHPTAAPLQPVPPKNDRNIGRQGGGIRLEKGASAFLQTREVAAINRHCGAKDIRMDAETALLNAHTAASSAQEELLAEERRLLQRCIRDARSGDLDVDSYASAFTKIQRLRAEADQSVLAPLRALHAAVSKEEAAVKELEDLFWS